MKTRLVTAAGAAAALSAVLLLAAGGPAAARPVPAHRPAVSGTAHDARPLCPAACRSAPAAPRGRVHPRLPARATSGAVAPPAGSWGYDMNGTGCNGTSFKSGAAPLGVTGAAHLGFDAIQLNGWGWNPVRQNDPCYAAQAQWYQQNAPGTPLQFIIFPMPYDNNGCGSYSVNTSDGHAAGYGQAQQAYNDAIASGLPAQNHMWWLDVEQPPPGQDCTGWHDSVAAINLSVIQGAVDFLHGQGVTVGIYTDGGDWNAITGTNKTQFANIPAWNANPYYTNPFVTVYNNSGQALYNLPTVLSWAQAICHQGGFTGGPLQAVQYMWGDSGEPFYQTNQPPAILGRDFDYECTGGTGPATSLTDLFLYDKGTGASYAELANGAGGWTGVPGPAFAAGWDFYPGNLDGNAWTDMFLYNPTTGASWVEFGNGAGGWANGVKGPQFSPGWTVYTGNFDHNNLTDLFLYNKTTGASYVELADGHGGWTAVKGPAFAPGWDFYPGTLNNDAYTDFFLYNPSTGASWAEFSDGAGNWTSGVKGPQFSTGWTVYYGHFNHDAYTDLFLYNKTTGASYAELADGHGGWTAVKGPAFAPGWNFYPATLSNDGLTDLFLYNSSTGASWTEFSDGAGNWINGVKGPQFATGWNIYPATLNTDPWTDLFLYNPATGASWTELADGAGHWINGVKGPQFSTGWTIYTGQFG